MVELPHGGSVTTDRDAVSLVASNFRIQPEQRRDEIPLSSAHWWRPSWLNRTARITEASSDGAIADHHATPQYSAGTAYLRTLNVVMTTSGEGGGSSYLD
jgi:hypothetical protein